MSAAVATSFAEQFDQLRPTLAGDPDALAEREAALERFTELGFPSRKLEQWRYTDTAKLRQGGFDLAPPPPDTALVAKARALVADTRMGEAALRCVFVDGHLVAELSDLQPDTGVEVLDLAQVEVSRASAGPEFSADHALVALNAAFARTGVLIGVAKDTRVAAPIQLLFVGARSAIAPQVRVVVDMAAHSSACIVQHFVDLEGSPPDPGWLNLVTEARQSAGSRLAVYRLQEHRVGAYHTALLRASVGRDASLVSGGFDLGGTLVRNDYAITLAETGAMTDLYGIAVAGSGQHVDNHVAVDHRAPHTQSIETFRSIVGEHGRAVFNGKVVVREGAQKIDARQSSNNLLLSEHAEVDTRPELEIYADDVKCSHGATVGELDEEQLFYLRSRGVDEEAARGLLTYAFANTLVERIELPAIAARVSARIAGGLPEKLDVDLDA